MRGLFISILNMSLSASFVAAAVMLLRLILKRAPKVFSYALWAIVLFRLICPFSFESVLSLLAVKPDAVPQDIVYTQNPSIESGIGFVDNAVNRTIENSLPPVRPEASVNPMGIVIDIGSYIWLAGILILVGYGVFSYVRLKRRLNAATLAENNIYETDRVTTPFVLGFLCPAIYLPLALAAEERDYILRHEQTHIQRRDYLVKPLGFLALTLHWFNPLVWLSYRLMCRDMEMSCDERVLGQYSEDIRAKYSGSLLSLSMKQSGLLAPLAFGESDAKSRIKNVLHYKKPAFWLSIAAVIVLAVAGFCLLANPTKPAEEMSYAERLLQYRTEYVGDNSKVGGIVSTLEYPEKVGYNFFQIFSGSPPLSVTVRLDTDTDTRNFYTGADNEGAFRKNAILIFALIGNVEYVSFELDDGVYEPYLIQYTRQWAENSYGSMWEQSASLEAFEDLMRRIEEADGNWTVTDYQGLTKEEYGGGSQGMLTFITFPVNDGEYNAAMYEIEPFDFYLSLPDGWSFREWGASNAFNLIGVFSRRTIFNESGECVGAVGCNIYEPYEGAEEDPRAIYNQIALGNDYHFDVRDSYTVVNETESGKTALADVYYSASINNGVEKTNKGIVSYNKDFLVYIAMEFDGGKVTDGQITNMAKSARVSASAFTGAVAQANRDKEQVLKALQDMIAQYRAGAVVNNELEPRFDPLPADAVLRDLNGVDDFAVEASGNDMFAIRVTTDLGRYTANFYLSPMGPRAEEVANGSKKEDDYAWAVNAVGIHPIPELQYDFFTVPEMNAEQQAYYDGYLRQLIYTGLLMRDWSAQDYAAIAAEPSGASNGSYLILAFEDTVGSDEMQRLFTEYNGDFPAGVIEDVLLSRFPFTAEQLHEILSFHYRADTNTYYYEGGRGGGPIEAAVTGVREQGEFIYLNYEFFNGYSGLDEMPYSYLYKTPGTLTLQRKIDGSYRYYAVNVGEQEEAPPRA